LSPGFAGERVGWVSVNELQGVETGILLRARRRVGYVRADEPHAVETGILLRAWRQVTINTP